jgi:hypothetical protein
MSKHQQAETAMMMPVLGHAIEFVTHMLVLLS